MRLIFVHGWSVTNTNTYGELPEALATAGGTEFDLDIQHTYLGRYISFHDEVTMDDIARAMDRALRDLPGNNAAHLEPFSCITHSTGGPVVRFWVDKFYGADAQNNLEYDYTSHEFYPFVLAGQGVDRKFYDFLNSYLVEPGSDGVVRVAGANMNYRYFYLLQNRENIIHKRPLTYALEPERDARISRPVPIGVYSQYSHSGEEMGIMRSITANNTQTPVVQDILKCFRVDSAEDYRARADELEQLTTEQQANGDRFCMLVFNVCDDEGEQIRENNYDLYLLAGNGYKPHHLPKGFFRDKQMNDKCGRLVYYLDANKMNEIKGGKFGLRVVARPSAGFSYYCAAEFHSDGAMAASLFKANQTSYINIKLHRCVDKNVFRFDPASVGRASFKKIKPSGDLIDNR